MTDNHNHVDVSSAAEIRRTSYRQALARLQTSRTVKRTDVCAHFPSAILLCIHASHRLGLLQARDGNLNREGPNRPRQIPQNVPVGVQQKCAKRITVRGGGV